MKYICGVNGRGGGGKREATAFEIYGETMTFIIELTSLHIIYIIYIIEKSYAREKIYCGCGRRTYNPIL